MNNSFNNNTELNNNENSYTMIKINKVVYSNR